MLDTIMPTYDFAERHRRRIHAGATAVWAALDELTLADLTVTRPLVSLRHLGRAEHEPKPLLRGGPVQVLHREDGRLAVAGAIARPWQPRAPRRPVDDLAEFGAFDEAGWTKYLTEFRVVPDGDGCVLATETRGRSTDGRARRRFRVYWTLIRIPSGIIRRDILRAVDRIVTAR